jgi:hypothetical protein
MDEVLAERSESEARITEERPLDRGVLRYAWQRVRRQTCGGVRRRLPEDQSRTEQSCWVPA